MSVVHYTFTIRMLDAISPLENIRLKGRRARQGKAREDETKNEHLVLQQSRTIPDHHSAAQEPPHLLFPMLSGQQQCYIIVSILYKYDAANIRPKRAYITISWLISGLRCGFIVGEQCFSGTGPQSRLP